LGGSNYQRNISDLSPVDVGKKGKNKKKNNNNKNSFHRPLVPLGLADPTDVVGSKCEKMMRFCPNFVCCVLLM
jgi:hypothetical protein